MMETIVVTSGGFDPVHIGHIRMFRAASELGDWHIVILNDDNFLLRKKKYVFMPFNERQEILESIIWVDEVFPCIDKDDSVNKTLEMIRTMNPNAHIIFANGGDRKNEDEIREAKTCSKHNIELSFNVGGGKIQSSSSLTRTHGIL